jgi:hypothetical protein
MKQNTPDLFGFTPVHGKKVTARFEDAQIASDGGLLLAAEVEPRWGSSTSWRVASGMVGRRGRSGTSLEPCFGRG